jgi:hypothetical protein
MYKKRRYRYFKINLTIEKYPSDRNGQKGIIFRRHLLLHCSPYYDYANSISYEELPINTTIDYQKTKLSNVAGYELEEAFEGLV